MSGATPDAGQASSSNTGGAAEEDALAQALSRLARDMQTEDDAEGVMARIVQAAVSMVPGVQEGSISMVHDRRRVVSRAPSGELPQLFDHFQEETGQGPCLDAAFEHRTVRVDDLASDDRWPALSERAVAAGIHGVLCFQLFVEGDNLGALNLISREPGAFGDESEHVGLLLASHAAIAVADAQQIERTGRALDARDVIGQAKGILMERFKITPVRAFDLLVRASQHSNRKLVDVAEELARSGHLDA